jgi:hypothetical protein
MMIVTSYLKFVLVIKVVRMFMEIDNKQWKDSSFSNNEGTCGSTMLSMDTCHLNCLILLTPVPFAAVNATSSFPLLSMSHSQPLTPAA